MSKPATAAPKAATAPVAARPVPAVTAAAAAGSAVIPFKLADIGEGIAEVELMKWYVKVSSAKF